MIANTENSVGSNVEFPQVHQTVAAPERSCVRVWLTDDNLGFRNLLAQLLARSGEFVCERQFHSAEALLDGLATEPAPDVILLDVEMGGMNGVDALIPIRALAPSVRVLIVTSFFDPFYDAKASRDGASAFLLKADAPQNLARAIHRALASPIRLPVTVQADFRQLPAPTARVRLSSAKSLIGRVPSWLAQAAKVLLGHFDYQGPAATPK